MSVPTITTVSTASTGPLAVPNSTPITVAGADFGSSQATGTAQVNTATAVGTITTAGNAAVVLTSAEIAGSPITFAVAVAENDTASQWAVKVRAALNAHAGFAALFTAAGSTGSITMTAKTNRRNDTTLNLSLDNGTCVGITAAPTSTNGTPGVGASNVIIGGLNANITSWAATSIVCTAASGVPLGISDVSVYTDGGTGTTAQAIIAYDATDARDGDEVLFWPIDQIWLDGEDYGYAGEGMKITPSLQGYEYTPPNTPFPVRLKSMLNGLQASIRFDQITGKLLAKLTGGTWDATNEVYTLAANAVAPSVSICAKDINGGLTMLRNMIVTDPGSLEHKKDFVNIEVTFRCQNLTPSQPIMTCYLTQ
jgi:hypothetical protein